MTQDHVKCLLFWLLGFSLYQCTRQRFRSQIEYHKNYLSFPGQIFFDPIRQPSASNEVIDPETGVKHPLKPTYRLVYEKSDKLDQYYPVDSEISRPLDANLSPGEFDFILWELKTHSASAWNVFHAMSSNPLLAHRILKEKLLWHFIPEVFTLAALHDPMLLKQMLNAHNLVNFGSDPFDSYYILDMNTFGRAIVDILQSKNLENFPLILNAFDGDEWAKILLHLMYSSLDDLAIEFLKEPKIMQRIDGKKMHEIISFIIETKATLSPELIQCLLRSHIDIEPNQLNQLLLSPANGHSVAAVLFNDARAMAKISNEAFQAFINHLIDDMHMNKELLQSLISVQDRIDGMQWAKLLSELIKIRSHADMILSNELIMNRISENEFIQVKDAIKLYPFQSRNFIRSLAQPFISFRFSGIEWGAILYQIIGKTDNLAKWIVARTEIMERIPDQFLDRIMDRFCDNPLQGRNFLEAVSHESLVSRIPGRRWGEMILSLIHHIDSVHAISPLWISEIIEKIPRKQFVLIINEILGNDRLSKSMKNHLVYPFVVDKLSTQQWKDIINSLQNNKKIEILNFLTSDADIRRRISQEIQDKVASSAVQLRRKSKPNPKPTKFNVKGRAGASERKRPPPIQNFILGPTRMNSNPLYKWKTIARPKAFRIA